MNTSLNHALAQERAVELRARAAAAHRLDDLDGERQSSRLVRALSALRWHRRRPTTAAAATTVPCD